MADKGRFSKGKLVSDLRERAERVRAENDFDASNGWAQLRKGERNEATDALIERAVAYGKFTALQMVATDVECGSAGT